MNRINQLFATKKRGILSIYFCAGYPTLDGTREIIKNLEQNGIDMIEIGIPFSDPMADGPVIQHAATQALHNGMTLKVLFSQLSGIRNDVTSEERIRLIDDHTDGFIYMVSSAAITGAQKNFDEQRQAYFRHIESMRLKRPRMIGFGISNRQTFETACAHASGAIIGSKFVSLLEEECDTDRAIKKLLEALYESNGISD